MISTLLIALAIWTTLGLIILFDHATHSKPAQRVALLAGPVLVLIGITFQLGFNLIKKLAGRKNKA